MLRVRRLALTLLVFLLTGGGLYALSWWENRPGALLESAQKYFERGEDSRRAGDAAGARRRYEYADIQLQTLLAGDEPAQLGAGLLLRCKVLMQLSALAAVEEKRQGPAPVEQRSAELYRAALRCAERAAADPANAEAQTVLLGYFFRLERFDAAEPYAVNLLNNPPTDADQVPHLIDYQAGARFVLAWNALHGDKVFPDIALAQVQAGEPIEKGLDAKDRPAGSPEPPTRWRTAALRILALKYKVDYAHRENDRKGPVIVAPNGKDPTPELEVEVAALLERVKHEKREPAWPGVHDSPTNLRGLLDFLIVATSLARDRDQLGQRGELTLGALEQLSRGREPDAVVREVARHAGLLALVLDQSAGGTRLAAADRARLALRIDAVAVPAVEAPPGLPAETLLALARNAAQAGKHERADVLARKALAAGADSGLPPDAPVLLEAHARAAWTAVAQDRCRDAEEHLAPLRKGPRGFAALAQLLDGLIAVHEGRLDQGARDLEQAARDPQFSQDVLHHLGLAHAYLGLGRNEAALPHLKAAEAHYQKVEQLSGDEEAVARQLQLSREALDLALCRCHLGLGQLEEAQAYRGRLGKSTVAALLLIQYHARLALEKQAAGNAVAARESLRQARRELEAARKSAPDDLALLWAEVELLRDHPEANTQVVAGALAALPARGGPAAPLPAAWTLRQGLDWNVHRAEELLRTRTRVDNAPGAQLLWARWLLQRRQFDEADRVLAQLEEGAAGDFLAQVQLLRAEWLLAQGDETDRLVAGSGTNARGMDLLSAGAGAGLEHYRQGDLALARGEFREAARAYARALQFVQFREAAQRGLLRSVHGLMRTALPQAFELVAELRRTYPDEPAPLLAAARAELLLGDLYGAEGMEGTLQNLERSLARQAPEQAAHGPYASAECWLIAGRPDLARLALDRGLRVNPGKPVYFPALLRAGRLALADEDWSALLAYADILTKWEPEKGHTPADYSPALAAEWRALALEGLGDRDAAHKVYDDLLAAHPERPTAYLGLLRQRERARDFSGALELMERARSRFARGTDEELQALRQQVRLLVATGKKQDAQRLASQCWSTVPAGRERDTALALAHGFFDASAYDPAIEWAGRARTIAEASAGQGSEAVHEVLMVLGDLYLNRCLIELLPTARTAQARKAVEAFRAVVDRWPGDVLAANNLAWLLDRVLAETGPAYEVVQGLRRGTTGGKPVTGDRFNLAVLDTMGQVYRDAGHAEEAVALFQEALRRYAREPIVYLHLGRSLAALKRTDEARRQLAEAARLAEEKASAAADPPAKAQWQALADEARRERGN